ncbi:MAG TPA: hypothetical protein VGN64_13920 [Dyadobacter sp.]|jgi:hypothetical protein|nr:hypothetical protein [Dyadobacter sp.]
MALKDKITELATENSYPSVTISLNTHRTHPDSERDAIVLKNLLSETNERLNSEFDKREIQPVLDQLNFLESEIDINYNLDSLHIFISKDTREIIKSPWKTQEDVVHINDSFAIKPLLKAYNRSEEYMILLVSQSGVRLFEAINDSIATEVKNEDFPTSEKPPVSADPEVRNDPKKVDDTLREYLNKMDKSLVKIYNETGLKIVCICTETNYVRLMEVADRPDAYLGYAAIDYNNSEPHQLATQAWDIIRHHQKEDIADSITEMKEAVGQGMVVTDLQEIYRAAKEGRGELLIAHERYSQPAHIIDDFSIEITENGAGSDAVDDITSKIAWEVISKGGRAIFTSNDAIKELGEISLKTRY